MNNQKNFLKAKILQIAKQLELKKLKLNRK